MYVFLNFKINSKCEVKKYLKFLWKNIGPFFQYNKIPLSCLKRSTSNNNKYHCMHEKCPPLNITHTRHNLLLEMAWWNSAIITWWRENMVFKIMKQILIRSWYQLIINSIFSLSRILTRDSAKIMIKIIIDIFSLPFCAPLFLR